MNLKSDVKGLASIIFISCFLNTNILRHGLGSFRKNSTFKIWKERMKGFLLPILIHLCLNLWNSAPNDLLPSGGLTHSLLVLSKDRSYLFLKIRESKLVYFWSFWFLKHLSLSHSLVESSPGKTNQESDGATTPFNALHKTINWTSAFRALFYTPMEHALDNAIMVLCAKNWPFRQAEISSRPSFRIPASYCMNRVHFHSSFCSVFMLILNITFTWRGIKSLLKIIEKTQVWRVLRRSSGPILHGKGSLYETIQHPF